VFANPDVAPEWDAVSSTLRESRDLEHVPLKQLIRQQEIRMRTGRAPRFDPVAAQNQANETRMNRTAFDYVVANNLYNVEGQEVFFAKGENLDFPLDAMEIKAQWRRIQPQEAARYHSAKSQDPEQLWGLTSLHITTKDLPNWFWATFEHKDNPAREAVVPSRDSHGLPESLKGTRWENYVLRGTQVNFVDSVGRTTILASSQIERGFQRTSSCITCHARATIGEPPRDNQAINRLTIFEGVDGSIGPPTPAWFVDTDRVPQAREYVQTDFVWSLFRAARKTSVEAAVSDAAPAGGRSNKAQLNAAQQAMREAVLAAEATSAKGSAKFIRNVEAAMRANPALSATRALTSRADIHEPTVAAAAETRTADSTVVVEDTKRANTLQRALVRAEKKSNLFSNPTWRANQTRLFELSGSVGTGIFGGRRAYADEFPDCVSIGDANGFCCTGTLIGANVVVTAGHCVFGDCASRVYVGLDSNAPDPNKIYNVKKTILHPNYSPATLRNDVAIVVLEKEVPGVMPRRIAPSTDIDSAFYVRLAGYGLTERFEAGIQMTVDCAVATLDCNCADCSDDFGCHAGFELVAGGMGLDSCNGDSGGPAYIEKDGELLLAGATSRATTNAAAPCGEGGIYVRIDKYRDWIEQVAAANGGRIATPPAPTPVRDKLPNR
jgi:hypothetical protein